MRAGRTGGMAAVLFTDLVGSTELLARLGDVAFDALRREHFTGLREAVERAGGEEVKTLGDGILAIFGSAADAVAAAIGTQQAVECQSRQGGIPLALRVGLALGDVSFEEDDVFGTPVVEAARLVAAARPGQILATAVIRMVAGGRTGAAFTDLGFLELKGLPEPVAVCDVGWEPLQTVSATVPLPPLLAGAGRIFVGRDEELGRLRQLWKEAAAGGRRLGLLSGEPGIGKTRLAAELAGSLHAEGAAVLAGRCDEDLGVPYQPFVESLRHYVGDRADTRLGRHGGELCRLVPELAQLVPGLPGPLRSDPETERYRLFDAVAAWLADVSAETPVLLVLDDLHWAAKPTLLLLRHILRSPEPLRLLVIGTYRDTDIGRGHPLSELLADLRRDAGVERFPVTGLDSSGVASFLEQVAGHELGEEGGELARAVWRETEGNAFFVVEVLRHLFESGGFERREDRWVTTAAVEELGIPEGVRDVIGRRLSRLSDDANRVLGLAAVVGPEFEPAIVVEAGDLTEDLVFSALEEAVTARLVVEVPGAVPRNRFAHALVRATLYDELSAARRVALHRHVAEAIEVVHANRVDDHAPALAHHWARASAPAAEVAKAVAWAKRAGDRALAQLAHDEAAVWYGQAIELFDAAGTPAGHHERLGLLIDLGEAQRRAGDARHRETLLEAARLAQEQGDVDSLIRAALANNRGVWRVSWATDEEQVGVLEAALAAAGSEQDTRRARLLASLGVELAWLDDRTRPLALTAEAVEIARRLGDPPALGQALLARCALAAGAPSLVADSIAIAEELARLAENLKDPSLEAWAGYFHSWAAFQVGRLDEARRELDRYERAAGEAAQPMLQWVATFSHAAYLAIAGSLTEAEVVGRAALEIGLSSGQADARPFFGGLRFRLRYEQGRLDEIVGGVEATLREAERPGVRPMLALIYCELDRDDEARSAFEPFASVAAKLRPDSDWPWTMAIAAQVSGHLRDASTAATIYGLLEPFAGQMAGSPVVWAGSVAHHLGLLATTLERFDEAEAHFAVAAGTDERMGAPAWLAHTRLEWARMLLRRSRAGDRERARELLHHALAGARNLGLVTVERRAAALVPEAG